MCICVGGIYGGGDEEVNTYSYIFKYPFTTFKEPGGRDAKSYGLEVRRPEGYMDLTTLWLCDVSKSFRIGLKQGFLQCEFHCREELATE